MKSSSKLTLPPGTKVPDHIAIILDGNRRWARARGLSPTKGHEASSKSMKEVIDACRSFGVHTLTMWGFSTENWKRSPTEIAKIMRIIKKALNDYRVDAKREGVRLVHLGRKDRLPKSVAKLIVEMEEETKNNKNYVLNMAIDYGGRDEIVRAVKEIVKDDLKVDDIDEDLFASYLDTADQPYPCPDLFIRPSGEQRTSGLMPWQMTYAEYFWEEAHLPDITPNHIRAAILDFSRRRRRYGGKDASEHFKFKPELTAQLELAWWRLARIPEGTKFVDYSIAHIKEQFGLSVDLSKTAARYMTLAVLSGEKQDWIKAKSNLKRFYKLIREEVKLAFEPELAASLKVELWRELEGKEDMSGVVEVEDVARKLYAEVYRMSLLQAAKLAHLRVMAGYERKMAERGLGEHHWDNAEDYLEKFYRALKDRVA